MEETKRAMDRLESALRESRGLSALLEQVESRARTAASKAGSEANGSSTPVLFVCAAQLAEIATAAGRGSRALPEAEAIPAERAEWRQWIQQVEWKASRTAAACPELAGLSMQASLLALETSLAAELMSEVEAVAELLRQASRQAPAWAAQTIWAARDAAKQVS